MTEESELCYICQNRINKNEAVQQFKQEDRTIVVHEECLALFGKLVEASLQAVGVTETPLTQPKFEILPSVHKEKDSEADAIIKVLMWASEHHPKNGLIPKETEKLFKDYYRWELSNASARLGELVVTGHARRIREGKSYRYYSTNKK